MNASHLAIPLGLAPDGALVRPWKADPALTYRCPGCGAPLLLRRSKVRQAHFAHRRGEGCAPESLVHRAAKEMVVRVVEEWKRGHGGRPCIDRPCPSWGCDGGVVQDLPDDITHAESEVRLPDGSVADVVLYRGGEAACVVEILATHAVDREKARRLTLPWVEVDADALLRRPWWWVATQDGLRPFACPRCRARAAKGLAELEEVTKRARDLAVASGQVFPPSPPYRAAPHRCWRCGQPMAVFLWPGGGGHSARKPPHPRPATVHLCATEGYGAEYWANCCPSCHAVQGDGYLSQGNADYRRAMELMRCAEDPDGEISPPAHPLDSPRPRC